MHGQAFPLILETNTPCKQALSLSFSDVFVAVAVALA